MSAKRLWQSAVARILSRKTDGLPANTAVEHLAKELRGSEKQSKFLDLNKLCAGLGLAVEYKALSVDALLHETESGYTAVLNSSTNKVRQRFSLAHELGHLVLFNNTGLTQAFGHISAVENHDQEAAEIEDLCDLFAAELLMPIADWRHEIFKEGISLKVLRRLTGRYGVSTPAAARRIIEADVWKCLIVSWEPVYAGDVLVELKRLGCWQNTSGCSWPKSLANISDFRVPGSPFCALENGEESIGKLSLPNSTNQTKFLAQSGLLMGKTPRVATVAIPEHYGWDIILRSNQ